MLQTYYSKPQTIDRIRTHWLGEPVERYVKWMHDQGYAARNVFRRVPILLRFGTYAKAHGAQAWTDLPSHVSGFINYWLCERAKNCRTERARKCVANSVRGPIEQMLRLALPEFTLTGRTRPFPFSEEAPGFVTHLRDERGLRPATVVSYRQFLRDLESYLKEIKASSVKDLSPAILSAYVTLRSDGWGVSMVGGLCGVLRVFLRYLFREKLIAHDLSQSIDCPRKYRLSTILRSISWTEVERMLAAVDRRCAVGKRDYAILLLLVTYGLRGREVAALTLDHIDWERQRLSVPERKAQPAGVAQAVVMLGNTDGEIGGLAISDPPTQTEVQALRDNCEELADDVRNLSTLIHSLRTALVAPVVLPKLIPPAFRSVAPFCLCKLSNCPREGCFQESAAAFGMI